MRPLSKSHPVGDPVADRVADAGAHRRADAGPHADADARSDRAAGDRDADSDGLAHEAARDDHRHRT